MKHLNLKPGEKILGYARQHPVLVAVPLVFEIGFILLAFFFMTPLFRLGAPGTVVFVLAVIFGAFLSFRSWLLWHSNVFIITDRRIVDIDRRGFFEWVVSEAQFWNIQDIAWNTKGLVQTIFGAGNVVVQTASGFVNLEIRFVKDPARVAQAIKDARDSGLAPAGPPDGDPGEKFSDLDPDSRRALSKYANHLRSKKSFKEFLGDNSEEDRV
ncbi:hypothetical protein A3F28_03810 [Candidatus Uhrbacteria bacterium RIFCSPHIGHO2_12_FULL_57_11]|uniref:YdbS-like PH domain-containing protein n=1 Tax=Candidatus Uhrbacteria bacterium RIFCSPHIGHO2_12_FULL_57_11 TaxID=1802398 RepID=A0A1F7ULT3_9BACT|nr:MAG: hypothetical protein A3F28_03810 [Candidatus Uhrbacteria bacterium RIFCSPHIGHO2_12_FULL_57_11]